MRDIIPYYTGVGSCVSLFQQRYSRTSIRINRAAPHFLFVIMPSRGWVAQTLTVMEKITAYSILKELGNDALCKYIYENIAEPTFDSHRITNPFPQDFRDYYERMLIAHADEGDIRNRNVIIANRIGIYLGRNSRDLQIEKIGEVTSTNMNGEETPTSFWKKLG